MEDLQHLKWLEEILDRKKKELQEKTELRKRLESECTLLEKEVDAIEVIITMIEFETKSFREDTDDRTRG